MIGMDTHFHCPKCNFSTIMDLGITHIVNYKEDKLAIRKCPKCNTEIAFKIIGQTSTLGNSHLNREGVLLKEDVINIISSNLEILKKSEEQIIKFILNNLEKNYTEEYLTNNAYEVNTIIEYILAKELYVKSYVYDTISKDCTEYGYCCF